MLRSYVKIQGTVIPTFVITMNAGERLLASVDTNMTLKITLLSCAVTTIHAGERFLTSVNSHMNFQLPRITEHFRTHRAGDGRRSTSIYPVYQAAE